MTDPTAPDERAVYADLLGWLLARIAAGVEATPPALLDAAPYEGATAVGAIAAHVHGATVAWALGIGAGQDVSRDRAAEFASAGVPAAELAAALRMLASRIEVALDHLDPARLDEIVTPSKALYGEGDPHPMPRRRGFASAIRHCAIHLGHLEITLDLLQRSDR
ncbi:MAG: DinB family protein [Dehalococcoidia bacterium]|nr:MAG: DinB family protein [Dehalococcoidia bacterium]